MRVSHDAKMVPNAMYDHTLQWIVCNGAGVSEDTSCHSLREEWNVRGRLCWGVYGTRSIEAANSMECHLGGDEERDEDHEDGIGDRPVERIEHLWAQKPMVRLVAHSVNPAGDLVLLADHALRVRQPHKADTVS
jgi:hypothetical protein